MNSSDPQRAPCSNAKSHNNIPGQVSLWTPFWENINPQHPDGPNELYGANNVALSIQPGQQLFSSTFYQQSSGEAQFYLEDETTGKTAVFIATGEQSFYSGTSADFIAEFPTGTVGAQFQAFATGIDAQAVSGTWYNLNQTATEEFEVYNHNVEDLATSPLVPGGNEFSNSYVNCP